MISAAAEHSIDFAPVVTLTEPALAHAGLQFNVARVGIALEAARKPQ